MSIPYADLHCDTLTEMYLKGESLDNNNLSVSLKNAADIWPYIQTFAVFFNDDIDNPEQFYTNSIKYFKMELLKNESKIALCRNTAEIKKAISDDKYCAILSIENAGVFKNPIEIIKTIKNDGIMLASLTWNEQNKLAGGINSDVGLTELGRKFVTELDNLGIIPDVSHLNNKSFSELCSFYNGPIIASHSNCHSICNVPRNLTDEQIVEIFLRKGIIGINLYSLFLSGNEKSKIEDVYEHIEHLLSLGGEDSIAFGSDFDGCDFTPSKINNISDMEKIFDFLLKKNYSQNLISKIFFLNYVNFFKEREEHKNELY